MIDNPSMEQNNDAWKAPSDTPHQFSVRSVEYQPSNHILEVRHLDPRGPAFPGELITSGPCGPYDPVLHSVNVDLVPYEPPAEPIRVLLYVSGKYVGFATLGPDGFVQGEGQHSPWMFLESLFN